VDVYVTFTIDNADNLATRSRMGDDVSAVRAFCNVIETGNAIWTSFALKSGGSVVDATGDTGTIEVDASFLAEVPELAEQYSKAVGYTASVGVGLKISESSKALEVAKKRGGNVILLWDQSMASELEEAEKPTEKDILEKADRASALVHNSHQVGKVRGAHAGFATKHKPGSKAASTEPDAEAAKEAIKVANKEAGPAPVVPDTSEGVSGAMHNDFEAMLHQAAQGQEQKDGDKEVGDDHESETLKQKLVQILSQVKSQLPVLSPLQRTAPDAYLSILNLLNGVILLGRKLNGPEETNRPIDGEEPTNVQKSEDLEKAISQIPAGKEIKGPTSGESVHDYTHVLPQEHQKKFKLLVEHTASGAVPMANAYLYAKGKKTPIGHVDGFINHIGDQPYSIEPHSELDKQYHGKGLGSAMYEGLFSHAKHKLGIDRVEGGQHSAMASAVHQRLSAKHGLEYKPAPVSGNPNDPVNRRFPYGKYAYTLKEEMSANLSLNENEFMGEGHGIRFMCDCKDHSLTKEELDKGGVGSSGGSEAGRVHENLPVGTIKDGKLKIKHGDGGVSWNHGTSGLISAQDPGGVGGGGANTHAISSKVPNGR
jgi:hypothetical protein